jgi:hypothetical protein
MSSSLNTTRVSAFRLRRIHNPVGRRGDPARSIPTTTSGALLAIGDALPGGIVADLRDSKLYKEKVQASSDLCILIAYDS